MADIQHIDEPVQGRPVVAGGHDSRIGKPSRVSGGPLGFRHAALVERGVIGVGIARTQQVGHLTGRVALLQFARARRRQIGRPMLHPVFQSRYRGQDAAIAGSGRSALK